MGCGYVCPVCEGKGFLEDLMPCDYCTIPAGAEKVEISDEEWLNRVHEGTCCGDLGQKEQENGEAGSDKK